jgi:hypothetical protein
MLITVYTYGVCITDATAACRILVTLLFRTWVVIVLMLQLNGRSSMRLPVQINGRLRDDMRFTSAIVCGVHTNQRACAKTMSCDQVLQAATAIRFQTLMSSESPNP